MVTVTSRRAPAKGKEAATRRDHAEELLAINRRLSADFSRIGVYDLRSGKDQHLMQLLLTHEPQAVNRISIYEINGLTKKFPKLSFINYFQGMSDDLPSPPEPPVIAQKTPLEGGTNIAGSEPPPIKLTKDGRPQKKRGPPKGKGGRKPGIKNKKTLEIERLKRVAREAAAAAVAKDAAIEALERKGMPDSRRAKKVLENFMELFAGMAAVSQPLPPGMTVPPPGRKPDDAKFDKYAALAVDAAKALAPFQDPRYSAVIVGATVVTKIKVEGGMPDDFKPSVELEGAALPALTVITAEDDPPEGEESAPLPPPRAAAS